MIRTMKHQWITTGLLYKS